MHPSLSQELARSRQHDLLREAEEGAGIVRGRSGARRVRAILLIAVLLLIAGGAASAHAAFVQQATLTAADGAALDAFGARTAVSASGNTMVVPSVPEILGSSNPGAVYVFE